MEHRLSNAGPPTFILLWQSLNDGDMIVAHREIADVSIEVLDSCHPTETAGDNLLIFASRRGRTKSARVLAMSGMQLETRNHWGMTACWVAAYNGHVDIVDALQQGGADLEATESFGVTPLMAACRNGHLAVAKFLHGSGVHLEAADNRGKTALHHACHHGRIDLVRYLIESCDVSIEPKDKDKVTPIAAAASSGHHSVLQYLKSRGAAEPPTTRATSARGSSRGGSRGSSRAASRAG